MIKKSVYKGIPYQIEISNTHNRLLTQNPPQKSTIDLKSQGLRTKIKITRAVELRSLNFWMFWKATNLLFHLSTGFMGVWARYPAAPRRQRRCTYIFSQNPPDAGLRAPAFSLESTYTQHYCAPQAKILRFDISNEPIY